MAPYRDRQMCFLRSFASCGQKEATTGSRRHLSAPGPSTMAGAETNDTLLHAKGTRKAYHHSYTSYNGDGGAKSTYLLYCLGPLQRRVGASRGRGAGHGPV